MTKTIWDKALSWFFIIVSLFLAHKPSKAINAIKNLIKEKRVLGSGGVEYNLCTIEAVINKRISGATGNILHALISYLRGSVSTEQLAQVCAAEFHAVDLNDVVLVKSWNVKAPDFEEYPDLERSSILSNVAHRANQGSRRAV